MTDIFREIQDDLRRDQAKKLWEKYGLLIVGLAVGIVVVAAVIVGWRAHERSLNEESSARYDEIVAAAQKQKPEEAAKAFADFSATATAGYATMAKLRQAGALLDAGDRKGAVAVYDAIAGDTSVPEVLRGMARVKAGLLVLDTASYDEMKTRMAPIDDAGSAWRDNARELTGFSAWKAGKYAEAEEDFDAIVADTDATPSLRDRAHVMQALIAPHLQAAEKADAAGAGAATTNNAAAANAAGAKPE